VSDLVPSRLRAEYSVADRENPWIVPGTLVTNGEGRYCDSIVAP